MVILWMNARKKPTQARVIRNASVTEICGTNCSPSLSPRTYRVTVRANTKVDRKMPNVPWTTRYCRKPPSTRGVNWLKASCSTTMVMEKTRPVTEIMAEAITPSTSRAPSGPPWKTYCSRVSPSVSSHCGSRIPNTTAARTQAAGCAQNGFHIRSHRVRVGTSGISPRLRRPDDGSVAAWASAPVARRLA